MVVAFGIFFNEQEYSILRSALIQGQYRGYDPFSGINDFMRTHLGIIDRHRDVLPCLSTDWSGPPW